jgi:hypothetical protein
MSLSVYAISASAFPKPGASAFGTRFGARPGELGIERDRHFRATKSLRAYTAEARRLGRVVT